MARRWYEYFATVSGGEKGQSFNNGRGLYHDGIARPAVVLRGLPAHARGDTGHTAAPRIHRGDALASIIPALAAGSAALTSLYVLVSRNAALSTVFIILTAALTAGAVFSLYVPPEHFGPGLYCVFIGLGAAAVGPIAKLESPRTSRLRSRYLRVPHVFGDPSHNFYALYGELSHRRLAREHHHIRAVVDRVRDIANVGTAGTRVLHHRFQHLGGGDDGFARKRAFFDHDLLHLGQGNRVHLHAEIARATMTASVSLRISSKLLIPSDFRFLR